MITAVLSISYSGCASADYKSLKLAKQERALARQITPQAIKVTTGGQHPNLDKLETVVNYPIDKVRKWFAQRKPLSPTPPIEQLRIECVEQTQEYLALNEMTSMYIDVRQYDPSEQWRRLRDNANISPIWKYSAGTLQHLEYCLIPARVTRRDKYNVFTNTLSINSSRSEQALYGAATAKYLLSKEYPGAASTACYFPIVPLIRDYRVACDVLSYARLRNDWEMEKRLYRQVYGRFGSDAVSQATSLIPQFAYLPFYVEPALSLGGRLVGSGTSYFVVKQREQERADQVTELTEQLNAQVYAPGDAEPLSGPYAK